jgi:hypothetical protein
MEYLVVLYLPPLCSAPCLQFVLLTDARVAGRVCPAPDDYLVQIGGSFGCRRDSLL